MKPLKPVMAALLAASSAAFALPGIAFADDAAHAQAVKDKDLLVPRYIDVIGRTPEARKGVGERLAKFVQGREPGKQYLTDGLLKDEKLLKSVLAVVKKWPEENKDKPGKVAKLYYVIGPEGADLPKWSPAEAKGKFKPGLEWSGRLAEALKSAGWSDKKQVAQTDAANAIVAFLNDAADWAQKVLDDARTKEEGAGSVDRNDTTGAVVPTTGGPRKNPLDASGAGFGFDDLYRTGAVTGKVYGPKDDGFRELSMKIYTVRNDDGTMQNMIGIVDITDPAAPYLPKYVPITAAGDQSITLRDGGRAYTVNITNGVVTVSRPDAKPGDGGAGLPPTSLGDLFKMRADQARASGTVRIPENGGQEYYVTGQADRIGPLARGEVLFFPKDALDNPTGDPRLLRPAAVAPVVMVDKDGVTVPVNWRPDLGSLPVGYNEDGTVKTAPFRLVFDARAKMWKVQAGAGDVDPATKKPAAAPSAPANPANPAGPTPSADGTTTPDTSGATTLDQVIALAKQGGWSENDELNAAFDAETKAKLHIMAGTSEGKPAFAVFFDPSMGVKGNQFAFATVIGDQPLKKVRGLSHYVIMEYPKQAQYFDYRTFAKYVSGDKSAQPAYSWQETPGIQGVDDVDVALDMVRNNYKNVDPKLEGTVRARVKKYAPNGGYRLSGSAVTLGMTYGNDASREIWPKDLVKNPGTGNNDGMTEQKGPGTVYTLAGGQDVGFPETMSEGGWKREQVDEKTGIALYSGEDTGLDSKGKATQYKRWAFMVRFKRDKDKPSRSRLITVFGEKGDNAYLAKPADLHMQGLADQEMGDTSILRMFINSTEAEGAISAYRTPASPGNAKDPARNCVGPVLWWGMTKTQAEDACKTDSKAP